MFIKEVEKDYEESADEASVSQRLVELSDFLKKFNNLANAVDRFRDKKYNINLKVDSEQFI